MRIIVAGTIGRSGLGGQAWAGLQYLLGFRALGHEVFYLEDAGDTSYAWHWEKEEFTYEPGYPSEFVHACLEPFGFGDRWIYRAGTESRGMPIDRFLEVCRSADLLLVRAAPLWTWRPEYDRPRRRAFIDVDPGFTQMAIANGDAGLASGIERCEKRFTLGQRIGSPDCLAPTAGGPWLHTWPPVFLPEWPVAEGDGTHFTSIIRWQGFRETTFGGKAFGQRDREFPKFIPLPGITGQKFLLAFMGSGPEQLAPHGWETTPGEIVSRTVNSYRDFIRRSRGEFSVPKHAYVATRGGWFSDRSVCYLASGRPVVMEDTGLNDVLPAGEGLVTFHDLESARQAVADVNSRYAEHRRAARLLAEQHFATDRVLPKLLEAAMN